MVADAGPGFGPPGGRSVACAGDAHLDCGHVRAAIRTPVSRHRWESTIGLCRCPCHATCPLADRYPVTLMVWQQLCACPGAAKQRAWTEDRDEPGPGATESRKQRQREWHERGEARKQAFQAARAAARGKSRDELRDRYITELRARGQEVPPEPFLEPEMDLLSGHPLRGLRKFWRAGPGSFFSGL